MAEYEYILVERDERVGIVMLNRPKELNALSFSLVGELADALEAFDRDESIGCIVLTGSGEKAFAAGADIKEMADKTPIDMLNGGFSAWQRIKRIQKPLIAAVVWPLMVNDMMTIGLIAACSCEQVGKTAEEGADQTDD